MAIPSSETLVDFAFYKPGQIALLLKDKSRVSSGGSTCCRLVLFALQDLPFMLLERYSNGTNQLSQHVFEVRSCLISPMAYGELVELCLAVRTWTACHYMLVPSAAGFVIAPVPTWQH